MTERSADAVPSLSDCPLSTPAQRFSRAAARESRRTNARSDWAGRILEPALAALRPHQWVKNLLLFVPVLAAHAIGDSVAVSASATAFVVFSLCASGVYVANDLLDVEVDRDHPQKRHRPFAARSLAPRTGITMAVLLVCASVSLSMLVLPIAFTVSLIVYLLVTTAYSVRLKQRAVADVMILAGLYVLRIVSGGLATGIPLSTWLLTFAMFFFLSLAYLKRYVEIATTAPTARIHVPGRGYRGDDATWVHALGLGSSYLSVVVLAIYLNSQEVVQLYRRPQVLLLLCAALLYWTTRVWLEAHRHRIDSDPIVAVVRDPGTYAMAIVGVVVVVAAI